MEDERLVTSTYNETDCDIENVLRPKSMEGYVGQEKVKDNLAVSIAAAKMRSDALDHVLLYGPPGLGKTTLAHIIAAEMGVQIKVTSGPSIEKSGDLAAILTRNVIELLARKHTISKMSLTVAIPFIYYCSSASVLLSCLNSSRKESTSLNSR